MAQEPALTWFICPNPGPRTLDGTCCYAVGRERLVLVDPGPSIPGQVERLEELVQGRPVEAICLTHAHADHSGIAELAGRLFGAPVAASAETLARLGLSGRALYDDDSVPVDRGKAELRAISTPGHAADHLAYLLEPGSEDGFVQWNFLDRDLRRGGEAPILRARRPVLAAMRLVP